MFCLNKIKKWQYALLIVFVLVYTTLTFTNTGWATGGDIPKTGSFLDRTIRSAGLFSGTYYDSYGGLSWIVADIIKTILGFLGVIFVVLIVYAGFLWMTAQGNEEKIKKAKGIIANAAVGLIIILAAYTITHFVIKYVIEATGGQGGSSGGGGVLD